MLPRPVVGTGWGPHRESFASPAALTWSPVPFIEPLAMTGLGSNAAPSSGGAHPVSHQGLVPQDQLKKDHGAVSWAVLEPWEGCPGSGAISPWEAEGSFVHCRWSSRSISRPSSLQTGRTRLPVTLWDSECQICLPLPLQFPPTLHLSLLVPLCHLLLCFPALWSLC